MQAKRPLSAGLVVGFLVLLVIDVAKGVLSNRVDRYLAAHPGDLAKMWNVIDWDYMPHLLASVAIFGLWRWSQSAPAPQIIERETVVYRDRSPAPFTIHKGLLWKLENGRAQAYCPRQGHENYRILFTDGFRTSDEFLAALQGDENYLVCPAEDEHPVEFDGRRLAVSAEFDAAALTAATRMRAG